MSWKVEVCIQKSLALGAAHHDHGKLDFSTLLFLHLYYFAKPNENSDPVLNMIHFQKRNKIALFSYQMGFTIEKISYAKHKQTNTKNNLSHYLFLKRKTQNKQTNKHPVHSCKIKTPKHFFGNFGLSAGLKTMTQCNKKWKSHNWCSL